MNAELNPVDSRLGQRGRSGATGIIRRLFSPAVVSNMSLFEYILVVLVILIPLVIAVTVTMWTLEQARLRNRRNRPRNRAVVPPAAPPVPPDEHRESMIAGTDGRSA